MFVVDAMKVEDAAWYTNVTIKADANAQVLSCDFKALNKITLM